MSMQVGLTHIPTPRLRALLAALHHQKLSLPMTSPTLMMEGFHDIQDRLGMLAKLDRDGVHAVLVAVLAERKAQ